MTERPALCKPRTADSRPAPAPLNTTSTSLMPAADIALFAASCATTVAAKADDLRDPLKLHLPADAQEITLPDGSVIETIVLLNVALTVAIALGIERVNFFLDFAPPFAADSFDLYCFAKDYLTYSLFFCLLQFSFCPFAF